MDDIMAIVGIAATAGIATGLAMLVRWILVDRDDPSTHLDRRPHPTAHPWPVGVQEEEPFRWRVEALTSDRRGLVQPAGRASRRAPTANPARTALG